MFEKVFVGSWLIVFVVAVAVRVRKELNIFHPLNRSELQSVIFECSVIAIVRRNEPKWWNKTGGNRNLKLVVRKGSFEIRTSLFKYSRFETPEYFFISKDAAIHTRKGKSFLSLHSFYNSNVIEVVASKMKATYTIILDSKDSNSAIWDALICSGVRECEIPTSE